MPKFPNTLHVAIENRGTKDECIIACVNATDLASPHEAVSCAIYKLVSVGKVIAPARFISKSKPKW